MKRFIYFILLVLSVGAVSSCKSKEEKALDLIRDHMFKNLYDFESYEPIETKVDSAFTEAIYDSLIYGYVVDGLAAKELYDEAIADFEEAFSTMQLWSGMFSKYARSEFASASETAKSKLKSAEFYSSALHDAQRKTKEAVEALPKEFMGWKVIHRFRCKTKGGLPDLGEYVFIIDPKFKEIKHSYDTEDDSYIDFQNFVEAAKVMTLDSEESEETQDI